MATGSGEMAQRMESSAGTMKRALQKYRNKENINNADDTQR